jgi:hypothetical protein
VVDNWGYNVRTVKFRQNIGSTTDVPGNTSLAGWWNQRAKTTEQAFLPNGEALVEENRFQLELQSEKNE